MSEPHFPPKLSVVDPPPGAESAEPGEPRREARRLLPWLLLIAVVAFAWLWLNAVESTQRLEQRVSLLDAELASARDDLAASEAQMDQVRGAIEQVASEIEALRALAADSEELAPEGAEPRPVEPQRVD